MGINRELIRTLVKESKEGKIQMDELIDLASVIFRDTTKENLEMDVLSNAKNNMMDKLSHHQVDFS